MNWIDCRSYIEVCLPDVFNYEECLVYLNRSDQEILHQIKDGFLYKLLKVNQELVLFRVKQSGQNLRVEFPMGKPVKEVCEEIAKYVWEWFDLDRDLTSFYDVASEDQILAPLIEKHFGLRIVCIPDLFEALTWAVIGQQINLTFAYTCKKRFVERFGEKLSWEGETYWLYPSPEKIATLEIDDLRELQFSKRKAEYVIGIAKEMASVKLTKESLLKLHDLSEMQKALVAIRGIGAWTADYCIMKCLHQTGAFPIADVGLHNALKEQLGLSRKPTIDEIIEIAKGWQGWEAYATFYLWQSNQV